MSSFLSSEISSRAEDMLFTFLLSMSVEHKIHSVEVSFVQTLRNLLPTLGTSPSSFAAGRTSRKKPIYMTKWELQVMMPWQTPYFNPFTKTESNPTGQYLLSSPTQLLVGFHLPKLLGIKWHSYCIWHVYSEFQPTDIFLSPKQFCVITSEAQPPLWKKEVLALKSDCKIGLTTSQRSQLNSHLQTWSFLSLPTLGSTVSNFWVGWQGWRLSQL